jgi:diguanylate cyclase (GGDEF)-like protein/PAS domain S-box-containing protein
MKVDDLSKEQLLERIKSLKREITRLKEKEAQRIHTKKALIKSKATAYAFINATSDLVVLLNTHGIILEVNEAAVRRVGKPVAELTDKCIFDLFPPEYKDFSKVYFKIVQQTKEPMRFQDEYKGLIFNVCIYPILNDEGEVEKFAVFVNDDTKHRRNEELLHRYSQILSTTQDLMAYIDKNFIFRTVNDAYLRIYKKSRDKIVGYSIEELMGKEYFEEKIKGNIKQCLNGRGIQQQEWFDFPDGKRRCMYMSYYPLLAKDNHVTGVVLNSVDITKIKQLEEELKRLSITDPLTQIFNRTKFDQALKEEIKRCRRYNTELAIIMFDIDHFKHFNDTYGHDMGDKILLNLVTLVKKCIRDTDIFSRWGGEEFMLLLPHTSLENALKLAERVRIKVMKHTFDEVEFITCSFGVSEFRKEDNEETLIKRVDNALYESKRSGRNKVTVM